VIDIRALRADPDGVRAALARRGGDATAHLDRIIELDAEQRDLAARRDDLRAGIKSISKDVGRARGQGDEAGSEALMAQSRELGEQERELGTRAAALAEEVRDLLLRTPNLPSPDAPDGAGEADNVVLRVEGHDPAAYGEHQRVPHWEIGAELGILDFERATKISGAMFSMYRGWGARLLRAMVALSLDRNADAYEEIRPPTLVLTDTMVSTGHLPKFADEAYHVERDDLWAIPTAEVPLTSMHRDEMLAQADLPRALTSPTRRASAARPAPRAATRGASCAATSSTRSSCSPSPTARRRASPARRTSSPAARPCCGTSAWPTGWSTSAPATWAPRPAAPGTSRPTPRAATCGSRCRRCRGSATTRPAGRPSATAPPAARAPRCATP
jgi:hypothetical protein